MHYYPEVHRFLFTITAHVYLVPDHMKDGMLFDDPIDSKPFPLPFWKWVFDRDQYRKYKHWARQEANRWAKERIIEFKQEDGLEKLKLYANIPVINGVKKLKDNFDEFE